MADDPRAALDRMVAALEAHLGACQRRRGDEDPAVESTFRALADAFEHYDDALYNAYDEVVPFVLDDGDDDDDDDDEYDDEDGDEDGEDGDEDGDSADDDSDEVVPAGR